MSCAAAAATCAIESANSWLPVREAWYIYDPNDPVRAEKLFQLDPEPAYRWFRDTSRHAPYNGGPQYHGRGLVQTTHRYNYEALDHELGWNCADDPDLLLNIEYAAPAFAFYWAHHRSAEYSEARDWRRARGSVVGQVANPPGWERLANVCEALLA